MAKNQIDNLYSAKRTVNGNFAANPRVMAHDAIDMWTGAALYSGQIEGTGNPNMGVPLYAGIAFTSITVIMESGEEQVFKGVPAGSFLPILVTEVTATDPSIANPGELVALF